MVGLNELPIVRAVGSKPAIFTQGGGGIDQNHFLTQHWNHLCRIRRSMRAQTGRIKRNGGVTKIAGPSPGFEPGNLLFREASPEQLMAAFEIVGFDKDLVAVIEKIECLGERERVFC